MWREGEDNVLALAKIEGELRQLGAEIIFLASNLVEKERKDVEAMTQWSRQVPLIFLAILLVVMVFLTLFLAQQILLGKGRSGYRDLYRSQ